MIAKIANDTNFIYNTLLSFSVIIEKNMWGYNTATESEEENYIYSDATKDNEIPIKNPIKTFNRDFVSFGWSPIYNKILNDNINSSYLLTIGNVIYIYYTF